MYFYKVKRSCDWNVVQHQNQYPAIFQVFWQFPFTNHNFIVFNSYQQVLHKISSNHIYIYTFYLKKERHHFFSSCCVSTPGLKVTGTLAFWAASMKARGCSWLTSPTRKLSAWNNLAAMRLLTNICQTSTSCESCAYIFTPWFCTTYLYPNIGLYVLIYKLFFSGFLSELALPNRKPCALL